MPEEKILFQYILNYKAYRRIMLSTRITITAIVAGGLAGLCAFNVVLGIMAAVVAVAVGVIWIIIGLHKERTYTIYNTRCVIKFKEKSKSIPIESITAVKYKSAFYERDLLTGTLTITAKNEKGITRKYKMRHIFNGADGVKYLEERLRENEETKNEVGASA